MDETLLNELWEHFRNVIVTTGIDVNQAEHDEEYDNVLFNLLAHACTVIHKKEVMKKFLKAFICVMSTNNVRVNRGFNKKILGNKYR